MQVSGAMNFPKCSSDTKEKIRLLKITSPQHYLSITYDFRNCILSFTLEIIIIYKDLSMQGKSRRREMQFCSVTNNFYQHEFGMRINLSKETLKFMPNKCFLQKNTLQKSLLWSICLSVHYLSWFIFFFSF